MTEREETSFERSDVGRSVLEAGRVLMRAAVEMQKWSGNLDWSLRLVNSGVLKSTDLIRAFKKVRRVDFLPEYQKPDEGFDRPLGIGHNQTNSQPTLVAEMLELLRPRKEHTILDVGSGSAWTTALLATVVGSRGRVIGTERIPELVKFGRQNLMKYEFPFARIEHTPSALGFPMEGPYHRILVSAHMTEDMIPELSSQLSPRGGIMVAPIVDNTEYGTHTFNQRVVIISRRGDGLDRRIAIPDVGFVPLVYTGPVQK